MSFVEGTILGFRQTDDKETLERILWLSSDRSEVVLIDISDIKKIDFPYFRDYCDLEKQIEEGAARIISIEPDLFILAPSEDYLKKHVTSRDRKWNIIKEIVLKEPEIYRREYRGKLVAQAAENSNIAVRFVYQYLRQYWFYGKAINGLLNNYHNCGYPKGSDRKANPGCKSSSGFSYILTDADYVKFEKAIDKYHSIEKKNIRETFYHMLQNDYNEGYYREHGVMVPIVEEENCPTEKQFRYWYEQNYSKKKRYEKKYGKKRAEMNRRALVGNPTEDVQGPGALYEIDSTPADVLLLANDRKTLIGRAHVYLTKDVMSRAITGMHVCRNESWEEAMVALENASTNKAEYCAKYGVEIEDDEWPCRNLPKFIIADRGEMKSRNSNNLVHINVQIGNAPSGRGDLKPHVEQQFRRFNDRIRALLPGAIIKKHQEPGDKKPRDYALLTFEEFTKFVILFVLEFNKSTLSDTYAITREMFADKVELTPLGIWNWGSPKQLLHEKPRNLIRYSLLPKGEGTVTRAGLMFEKLAYTCDRGMEEAWFEEERIDGEKKIEVCFDPRNCSSIFIKLKDGKFEQLFLTAVFREYEGMHFDDVKTMLKYKKQQLVKGKKERINVEAVLNSVTKSMVKNSEEEVRKANDGRPKNAKFKNMHLARKIDKRIDSSKAAWTSVERNEEPSISADVIPFQRSDEPAPTQYVPKGKNNVQLFLMSKHKERRHQRD